MAAARRTDASRLGQKATAMEKAISDKKGWHDSDKKRKKSGVVLIETIVTPNVEADSEPEPETKIVRRMLVRSSRSLCFASALAKVNE